MDTKLFSYFTVLCRNHGVAAAARELNMTPQGLSSAIKRLEAELGAALFTGSLGASDLTEHGRYFLEQAQLIEESLGALHRGMDSITAHVQNVVTVGCSLGILGYLGEDVIDRFNEGDTNCQILLSEELPDQECEKRLIAGEYDYALLINPIAEGLVSVPIVNDYQFLWVNRRSPLAEKTAIGLDDLEGQTVITMGDDYRNTGRFIALCQEKGVRVDLRFTSEMIRVYELVRAGRGLGLTCRNHIEATSDSRVTVGVPLKPLSWGFSLCSTRDHVPSEAEVAFLDYMRGLRRVYD